MPDCFVPTDYLLAAAEAALGSSRVTPAAAKRVEQAAIWNLAWEAICRRELSVALDVAEFAKVERFYTGPEPTSRE